MHPENGLRAAIDADQIAAFEWSATRVRGRPRIVAGASEGESEFEAVARMGYAGRSAERPHDVRIGGRRATPIIGLRSPTGRRSARRRRYHRRRLLGRAGVARRPVRRRRRRFPCPRPGLFRRARSPGTRLPTSASPAARCTRPSLPRSRAASWRRRSTPGISPAMRNGCTARCAPARPNGCAPACRSRSTSSRPRCPPAGRSIARIR